MNEEKNDWRMKPDWMKLEMTDWHQNCVAVTPGSIASSVSVNVKRLELTHEDNAL
jgi:hypothetical protein